MKIQFKYICLLSFLLFVSCNDFLDTVPDNRTDINTESKIGEVLVNAYPRASYFSFCELMSDNVADTETGTPPSIIYAAPYFWEDLLQDDEDSPQFYWSACYTAISHANKALDAVQKLPSTPKLLAHKGEALVARAYAHFMLVNLFSPFYSISTSSKSPGIPYVTEIENVVIKKYERKTVEYVYEQIEKDLIAGLELIDDNVYKSGKESFHFTRSAANAFATRFYLFKKDYGKVIEHANLVAPSNQISSLLRSWNDSYKTKSFNELTFIYSKSTEPANLLLAETKSYWGRYWNNNRYVVPSYLGQELFFEASPSGGDFAYSLFGNDVSIYLPKFNEVFVRTTPTSNIGDGYVTQTLFSAEEVLLNRAEAYLLSGNVAAALVDMNVFFSKRITDYNPALHSLTLTKNNSYYRFPNATSNQANILLNQTILDLRRREFLHEGLRWFDLLRYEVPITKPVSKGEDITLEVKDKRRVLQIPQEAVLSGLALNPR